MQILSIKSKMYKKETEKRQGDFYPCAKVCRNATIKYSAAQITIKKSSIKPNIPRILSGKISNGEIT